MSFARFVIPGLTKPALACPVLDTGYLMRGNPVFFWIPALAGMTHIAVIYDALYKNGFYFLVFTLCAMLYACLPVGSALRSLVADDRR